MKPCESVVIFGEQNAPKLTCVLRSFGADKGRGRDGRGRDGVKMRGWRGGIEWEMRGSGWWTRDRRGGRRRVFVVREGRAVTKFCRGGAES